MISILDIVITTEIGQVVTAWIVCAAICLFLEILFAGFFFCLSLALGALPAAACAWYGAGFLVQLLVFVGVSALSFFVLYWRMGMKAHTEEHYRSAVDALPGKKGVVIQKISSYHLGQVQVDGQIWSAQAAHQEAIEEGSCVKVIRVEGVRLIVKTEK